MAMSAHQRPPEDETDEELSEEQVNELLEQAERSLRAKQASSQSTTAPFRLPKLNPGFKPDAYLKEEGSITRLDPSKVINKEHRALAEGIKKIEDPIAVRKAKLEVSSYFPLHLTIALSDSF